MKGLSWSRQITASWHLRYLPYCVLALLAAIRLVAQSTSTAPNSVNFARTAATPYAGLQSSGLENSVDVSLAAFANDPPLNSLNNAMDAVEPQEAGPNHVPDAPTPQNPPVAPQASQTKRILGIIPNFRAVDTDQKLPAQSVKEKSLLPLKIPSTTRRSSFRRRSPAIRWRQMRLRSLGQVLWDTEGISGMRPSTRRARTTWLNS
jgi:hypothetical protein